MKPVKTLIGFNFVGWNLSRYWESWILL